eukprot:UC4_evm1s627
MLKANIAVAEFIHKTYPDRAFLRLHPKPIQRKMKELLSLCNSNGIMLNASSSGALHASLQSYRQSAPRDMYLATMNLLAAPMQVAQYCCAEGKSVEEKELRHYALAVDLYTHFTSPIRRYADVIVHRQLDAALRGLPQDKFDDFELQKIANRCNDRKEAAKAAGDASL